MLKYKIPQIVTLIQYNRIFAISGNEHSKPLACPGRCGNERFVPAQRCQTAHQQICHIYRE